MGRTTAFNATLILTAVFGVLSSLTNTFSTLCIALFLLGSAVGVRPSISSPLPFRHKMLRVGRHKTEHVC